MCEVRAAGAVEGRMTKRARVALPVLSDVEILPGLPPGGTRGACPTERPCPYVRCSSNVWMLTSIDMPGRRHNGKNPPSTLRITRGNNCALDWSVKENSAKTIGMAFAMSKRRIEQELAGINKKLRSTGGGIDVVRCALELLGLDASRAKAAALELERIGDE